MGRVKISKLFISGYVALATVIAVYALPTIDSDYLIGTVDPGSPADPVQEFARLQQLVEMYNLGVSSFTLTQTSPHKSWDHVAYTGSSRNANVPVPNLPDVSEYGSQNGANGNPAFEFDLGLGSDYTMVKWGDVAAYYWTRGLDGKVDFQNDIVRNKNSGSLLGGSHVVQFNRIPDGGITLILLGLGVTCLALLRRRLS
ncbi:MAG: hypothetical protein DRQ40_09535 [Gammaproteobacteria bacterium]|nr:MAG: hypothetical protein DRQ40_09535 [Gammaproteobacteria bacterium]